MMISTEIDIALKKKNYEESLVNIKGNVKRISELLDTLSLITRLESGTKVSKEPVKLSMLIKEVVAQVKKIYPKKKISIQGEKEVIIQAQSGLLEIALKNLIENACKYTDDATEISILGTEHSLSIRDTGVGIAAEFQDKIFQRFWQLEKTEEGSHSFGLGLYLVKKIVDLHGWKISVESAVGEGSTFIIAW
jgi:signal transduction histidine kinase